MKELDFDELDRAVNSLMGDAPKSNPVKSDDGVTTVTLPEHDETTSSDTAPQLPAADPAPVASKEPVTTPAQGADATPVSNASSSNAEPATPPEEPKDGADTGVSAETVTPATDTNTSARQPRITPHRAGRFMDMKHASSDMKTKTPLSSPSKRPSRQGAVLAPVSDQTPAPSNPLTEAEPATSSEPLAPTTPTEGSTASNVTSEVNSATPEEKPADAAATGSEYSAFLPDAKVEKRPLGRTANSEEVTVPETPEAPDTPPPTDTPLPEEYDQKLMAIESGNTEDDHAKPEDDTKASEDTSSDMPTPSAPPSATIQSSVTTEQPTGPTSIAQQYTEEPSSGDQTNGAIYDTAAQPLAHPPAKKSGWLWAILIVVVILLGVGAGAFIYLNGL